MGCSNAGHGLATREDTQAGTFRKTAKALRRSALKACANQCQRDSGGGDESNRKRPKSKPAGPSRKEMVLGEDTNGFQTTGLHSMRTEMGSRVWGPGSGGNPERAGQLQGWTTGAGSPAEGCPLPLTPPTGLPCMTGAGNQLRGS